MQQTQLTTYADIGGAGCWWELCSNSSSGAASRQRGRSNLATCGVGGQLDLCDQFLWPSLVYILTHEEEEMKILFDDPFLDGKLLRALGYVYYGGADIGE